MNLEKEPELIGKDTQVPLSISSEDVGDIKEVDVIDEFKKDFEPSENEQVPKCHISDNVIEGNLAQNVEKVNNARQTWGFTNEQKRWAGTC